MEKKYPKKHNLSDYEIFSTLGIGSFGEVKFAKNKLNGKFFAIKILKKSEIIRLKQVDHVINEYQILSVIDHPFIVKMEGYSQDSRYFYIILQYVIGGDLFRYLRNVMTLQKNHAKIYAAQIILVFQYLHQKNIIYRDLKPQNILIAQDGYIKLTDFGFAKVIQGRTFTLCGTPQYMAPQIILNKGHGKAVDWWTLGVLIYEMHVGIDPFSDEQPMNIYQNIIKGKIFYPKNMEREVKSLIKHLLTADLSQRFGNLKNGINDIKEHKYFSGINWNSVLNKKQRMPYTPLGKKFDELMSNKKYVDQEYGCQCVKAKDDPFLRW